jgi:hypothetical protein
VVRVTDEYDMNRGEANDTVDRSIQIEPTRMICTMGLRCMMHVTSFRGEVETWHVSIAMSHHVVAVVCLLLLAPPRNKQ